MYQPQLRNLRCINFIDCNGLRLSAIEALHSNNIPVNIINTRQSLGCLIVHLASRTFRYLEPEERLELYNNHIRNICNIVNYKLFNQQLDTQPLPSTKLYIFYDKPDVVNML